MDYKQLETNIIIPSSCPISFNNVLGYTVPDKSYKPVIGDVVYGVVDRINQHHELENNDGRIHQIREGTKSLFVYGNRYATGYYEGLVPSSFKPGVDLLARSGIIGSVLNKNDSIDFPTRIKILGVLYDNKNNVYNTKNYPKFTLDKTHNSNENLKIIVFVGSSMDSGKSTSASTCVWGLNQLGYNVSGSKITGTASLKDILHMQDAGAVSVNDFTYCGYPSTYMLPKTDIISIYTTLKNNCPSNTDYWVIEIADGILQRETQFLLNDSNFTKDIHKLVYCSADSMSCIAGIEILKDKYGLTPDILSGIFASSPLMVKELLSDMRDKQIKFKIYDNRTNNLPILKKTFLDNDNSVIKEMLQNIKRYDPNKI